MNNSTISSTDDVILSTVQICFGSIGILSNFIIFFVLLSNKAYFKKSAFIASMAFGDLLDGLSLTCLGTQRLMRSFDGSTLIMVHPSYCMKAFVVPSYMLGNQISSLMFLLGGIERFLAIHCYDWYYQKWSNKLAWVLTSSTYLYCFVSLAVAFVISYTYPPATVVPILCTVPAATSTTYTAYNYFVSITGGIAAIVGSLVAMVLFTKRKSRVRGSEIVSSSVKSHVKRQWNLTKIALFLAILDCGLVVIPAFLSLITSNIIINVIRSWSLQLLCLRSFLNLFVYLFINSDFRASALKSIGLENNVDGIQSLSNNHGNGTRSSILRSSVVQKNVPMNNFM